ncbi:hypothetical protein OIU79_009336 [Salix purpurea]|uniref:Uncharacterized protein n=1 Tax=Salix purpurea TaxID=77065 RepID=A0A9Q0TKC7_SALPP|nr:hypothetical protein OIU79_009336 [Salix purpurea]
MFLLEKVVFLSENMHGSGSRGNVFIGNKELGNFIDLILTSMVYESWINWLKNPRNVTDWIKNLRNDEHSMLRENLWILYGLAFPWEKGRLTTTDIVLGGSVVNSFTCAFE